MDILSNRHMLPPPSSLASLATAPMKLEIRLPLGIIGIKDSIRRLQPGAVTVTVVVVGMKKKVTHGLDF